MPSGSSQFRAFVCSIVALALSTALLAHMAYGAPSAMDFNAQGLAHYSAGRYAESVRAFRQAINLLPEDPTLSQNLIQALNGWGVQLGNEEKYEEAVLRLVEANRLAPDLAPVRTNLAVVRINQATREMERKDYSAAERLLIDAYDTAGPDAVKQIDDRRATIGVMQARELIARKQTAKAKELLKKALQIEPASVPAMLELADLLYEEGENKLALDYYLAARELQPDITGLSDRIGKIQREQNVEAGFERRSSDHFTVSFENGVNQEAAREVLEILMQARREIGRELRHHPNRRLPVVIYTQKQYAAATDAPDWSGAIFDGKIRVPIPEEGVGSAIRDQLRQTLLHEYTHALIHELVPDRKLPAWVNEGLACYFEMDRDARQRRDDLDRRRLRQMRSENRLVPVSELPDSFTEIGSQHEAEDAYIASRAFTYWLAERYRTARFRALLDKSSEGTPIEEAFKTVYGRELKRLEQEWLKDL